MVVQRGKDVFVTDDPENSEHAQAANQSLIENLQTLYNEMYRGFLSTDPNGGEYSVTKTEDELSLVKDSLATKEGSVNSSSNYIRLVQTPYVPQPGQNEPAKKDILFYIDPDQPQDLNMAVQNPEKLTEWKVYKATDYGTWFLKEMDIYLQDSRGL